MASSVTLRKHAADVLAAGSSPDLRAQDSFSDDQQQSLRATSTIHVFRPLPRQELMAFLDRLSDDFEASHPGVDPVDDLRTDRGADAAGE